MDDKRKSPRVKANGVVSFKVKSSRLAGGSRVKDISASGICIPSKSYFPVDSILELEVRSDDLKEPIKTLARVVRIAKRDKGNFQFEVGLEFIDFPIDQSYLLNEYMLRSKASETDQGTTWLE